MITANFTQQQTDNNNLTASASHLPLCGANFCQHFDIGGGGFSVTDETKYLLFGIYMGCVIMAMVIAVFMLEPLNPHLFLSGGMQPLQKTLAQLKSLAVFSVDGNFLLLLPLAMYSSIQYSFVSAEITKAFVTCPLGIHMVGYTMICLGVCGSVSSYLSGLLNRYTGRVAPILTATGLNLGVLIFLTQWQPNPDSLLPYFVVMGVWGVSDGIWISQVNIIMAAVFPDKYEEAFAGLRVAQGLGAAVSFGYSNSVCMMFKIYIMVASCVVSVASYVLMEWRVRRRDRQQAKEPAGAGGMLKQTPV